LPDVPLTATPLPVESAKPSMTMTKTAEVAVEPERKEFYDWMATRYPFFAEYERNTARVIPVIVLTRVE